MANRVAVSSAEGERRLPLPKLWGEDADLLAAQGEAVERNQDLAPFLNQFPKFVFFGLRQPAVLVWVMRFRVPFDGCHVFPDRHFLHV